MCLVCLTGINDWYVARRDIVCCGQNGYPSGRLYQAFYINTLNESGFVYNTIEAISCRCTYHTQEA